MSASLAKATAASAAPARCRSLLPKQPTSPTAARTARSAGHAVATAVHRRVQQCLCAVSPPPTPQAGLLAAPSHRERSRGPQTLRTNSCLCECRPLKEHMEVLLLLLLQRQQHDAADVSLRISVLLQPCCAAAAEAAAAGQRSAQWQGSKCRPSTRHIAPGGCLTLLLPIITLLSMPPLTAAVHSDGLVMQGGGNDARRSGALEQ